VKGKNRMDKERLKERTKEFVIRVIQLNLNSEFRIRYVPQSEFRNPQSAFDMFRNPNSEFRIRYVPQSEFRIPHSICSAIRIPNSAFDMFRNPNSAIRIPHSICSAIRIPQSEIPEVGVTENAEE